VQDHEYREKRPEIVEVEHPLDFFGFGLPGVASKGMLIKFLAHPACDLKVQ